MRLLGCLCYAIRCYWLLDRLVAWLFGCVVVGLLGCVVTWLIGCAAGGLLGCLFAWLCGCFGVLCVFCVLDFWLISRQLVAHFLFMLNSFLTTIKTVCMSFAFVEEC
jgi:hypothetical protein